MTLKFSLKKTKFGNSETSRRHEINTSLEIIIKDFRTATELEFKRERMEGHSLGFHITVYPNGFWMDETKDWLMVLPCIKHDYFKLRPEYYGIPCTVSIIDIEGNSRLPRSFTATPHDIGAQKYLRRSFILDREDEFLFEGVLTLRCEFKFNLNGFAVLFQSVLNTALDDFLESIPQVRFPKNKVEKEYSIDFLVDDTYTVFDFTRRIVTLPWFYEATEGFSVYGGIHEFPFSSDSKEEGRDILKDVWEIVTESDIFLLSFDEQHDNMWAQLLEASSVIRQCVNAPMKEQREKRIELSNVDSETFKNVLFFIKTGNFHHPHGRVLLNLYKFSHLYEMKELQRRTAEEIVKNLTFTDFVEVETILDLYSDEYLLELFHSHRHGFSQLDMFIPRFSEFLDDYAEAANYENKERQRKCAREMVSRLELPSDFKILKIIADSYSDEYLSELLQSRRHEFKTDEQSRLTKDDNPLSDCYI